ncbi:MAG: glycyl radical protein [Bacillota bacterium]
MGFKCSERIERLRDELLSTPDELCLERARLVTESYQRTEGEPMIIRRAKALKHVLENMTIFIRDGELIVGQQTGKLRGVPVFPETGAIWIEKELDIFDKRRFKKVRVSREDRETLREILRYWKDRTIHHQLTRALPGEAAKVLEFQTSPILPNLFIRNAVGHLLVDYPKVLRFGFQGIKSDALMHAGSLDLTIPDNIERYLFYEAVAIACDAAVQFGLRYSREAARLAAQTTDERRKQELSDIARVCSRVPGEPAESYREALQSFWLTHLIIQIDTDGLAISPGRFDQYIYPYYRADIARGVLTKTEAQELLNCLWLKFYEITKLVDNPHLDDMAYGIGNNLSQNLVVGGVGPDGTDVTNEISFMCLEAEGAVRLDQPSFSVRIHCESPTEFLEKVIEVVKMGGGKPALFFDQAAIPALLATGVPLSEARDYALCGCVEPATTYNSYTWANAAMFNLPKCLELALNDGVCMLTGVQMGPKTGSPDELRTFDQVCKAFKAQVKYFLKHLVVVLNTCDLLHMKNLPTPFVSALVDDCMARGKDITGGGARYNHIGIQGVGLADVADALAAVKEVVFDRKLMSLKELTTILKNNFEGREDAYRWLRNESPKFGNDDDRVDLIAREIGRFFCEEVSHYLCWRGGSCRPGLFPVASNVPMGRHVAALPSGRRSQMPLADGISPAPGCDVNGPTAVVKSVTKVDHVSAPNGTLLNLKFHPSALQDRKGTMALISLIRTMGSRQGMHMQLNVVGADTLRDAQAHPDQYRDLLIRVAGYSAFFVELDSDLQEHIISRTEHLVCS